MFGAPLTDIQYFSQKTMEQCVDELLTITSPMPDAPLKDYDDSMAQLPDSDVDAGTTWIYSSNKDGDIGELRKASLKKWWIGLMINQPRNIREKMTLFWHNHFSTEMASTQNALYAYKHHTLLRQNCLGNFKTLARAISIDPLMLVYQNGEHNNKYAPDENFARELQELFTIGKENNPNYTEDDVKAAARVLTGWRNNEESTESFFDLNRHDTGNKAFSSFYNNKVIQGKSGSTAGDEELDELINMIFSKAAEASRYIVKELYRWFVYYEIDQAAEENVIAPLAQMLQNHNWDIAPVLSTLLKSEHFFDAMNQGCLIKSPVDFIVGASKEVLEEYISWEYLQMNFEFYFVLRATFLVVMLRDFFLGAAFLDTLFLAAFFTGNLAPSFLASDSPIAMACLGSVTFFPLPLLSVPFFRSCIALSTLSCAFLLYFAIVFFI